MLVRVAEMGVSMSWRISGRGRHRRNGDNHEPKKVNGDIRKKQLEADKALREVRAKAEQVENVSATLEQWRKEDGFAKLFGDALGGV